MFKQSILLLSVVIFTACNKQKETQLTPPPANPPAEKDYTRPVTNTSSKWISEVVDFCPAPGQFVNSSIANTDSPKGIIGKKGLVSLGGFGGSITFMFDHTVLNHDGADFVIHANATDGSSEPGVVMVAFDSNGNGKADDEWYELKGEDHNLVKHNYAVTYTRPAKTDAAADIDWIDSEGVSGVISIADVVSFHRQCFYPLFLAGNPAKLTLAGSLLPFNGTKNESGVWKLASYGKGYADNFSADYMAAVGSDQDTERTNKFDLANAIDKDGKAVKLKGIDFVKVVCAINGQAGWIGEVSTEICGAISISVR